MICVVTYKLHTGGESLAVFFNQLGVHLRVLGHVPPESVRLLLHVLPIMRGRLLWGVIRAVSGGLSEQPHCGPNLLLLPGACLGLPVGALLPHPVLSAEHLMAWSSRWDPVWLCVRQGAVQLAHPHVSPDSSYRSQTNLSYSHCAQPLGRLPGDVLYHTLPAPSDGGLGECVLWGMLWTG